jgi:hypothetical protein
MRAPAPDLLHGARQDALTDSTHALFVCATPDTRAVARALPAALHPHAVAQLLPLLLLPPERVRALDAAPVQSVLHDHGNGVSTLLSGRLVRSQPSR